MVQDREDDEQRRSSVKGAGDARLCQQTRCHGSSKSFDRPPCVVPTSLYPSFSNDQMHGICGHRSFGGKALKDASHKSDKPPM
jgi:hypothetical protein